MTSQQLEVVLLAHVATTLFMTGLIWFVQVVDYPLLAQVGRCGFADYESAHVRLTTGVVAPTMLLEAVTALLLAVNRLPRISAAACWVGLGLLVLTWSSTVLLQVPQHNVLTSGFDARAHRLLVQSNWMRTVAWTARSLLVLLMLWQSALGGQVIGVDGDRATVRTRGHST